MKKILYKKNLFIIIFSMLFVIILGSILFDPFDDVMVFTLADFTANSHALISEDKKSLSTVDWDSQMETDFGREVYVRNINVKLTDSPENDWRLQVYVAGYNEDYSEGNSYIYWVSGSQNVINIKIDSNVQKLRMDWGDEAGNTFWVKNIRVNGYDMCDICLFLAVIFIMSFIAGEVCYYVWSNRKQDQRAKNIALICSTMISCFVIFLWISNIINGVNIFEKLFVASKETFGVSMTFTSLNFIFIFLPLVVGGYYLIKSNLRNIFLVIVSILFYATGEPVMIWLLLLSIFVNYVLGLLLAKQWEYLIVKRIFLFVMLIWNFGLLFYYKYYVFTLETISFASGMELSIPSIIQPLGISFFTFRTVSFCLDVYWGTVPVQYNFINVALYICFFPQILMGPISKYNDFAMQLNGRIFNADLFFGGIKRIIIGWAKKLIIANNIGTIVDIIFDMAGNERTVVLSWIGVLGYLVQLYYDFSGYTDIAIGVGQLFGFKTPENFNYPFVSKSVVEYWTRWHASLGTWLKNYIYTPIFRACQNKEIAIGTCNFIALIGVWLFAGIWHGAGWNYLCYGIYYCFFIILERVVDDYKKKKRKKLKLKKQPETIGQKISAHIYFFTVLIFGQLLFRCTDLIAFGDYVSSLFSLNDNKIWNSQTYFYLLQSIALLIAGWFFAFPIIEVIKEKLEKSKAGSIALNISTPIIYATLLIVSIAYAMTDTYQSFIYFQF